MLTGPGDQCEGSSQESFDMATYYTSKTYITTGQQQPIIESQLCAPGMICNSDGKCSTCTQYIHFHNYFLFAFHIFLKSEIETNYFFKHLSCVLKFRAYFSVH